MPFNLSFTHLLVVAIVALVVLGPERLPGAARAAGNLYREYKRVSGGLQAEVRDVFSEFTSEFTGPVNDVVADFRTGATVDLRPQATPATESPPAISPLAPAIPALGPSTGLVSAGPKIQLEIPSLGSTPHPETVVPHEGAPPSP